MLFRSRAAVNASAGAAALAPDTSGNDNSSSDLASRAADGLLINGSTNNGASSPFAQAAAFGNNRRGRALYNGGFAIVSDNSALNARPYSLTGQDTPNPSYNRVTTGFNFGGPLRIPKLVRNGPNFFFGYQRTQNRNASVQSGLMPTDAQRRGDLSQTSTPIIDPLTGTPFAGNQIPLNRISPQAAALLNLYPSPNFQSTRYNYQTALVGTMHQDSMQVRLNRSLNARNQIAGDFAMQRTASDDPNLMRFLDTNRTLGLNSSVKIGRAHV